jgi:prepilin-type processing-associated H-X9-DG protein
MSCQNNLKQIGLAIANYQDTYGHFPMGTSSGAVFPPDKRLSWCTEIYPAFLAGGIQSLLDRAKSWDAESNCPPRHRVRIDTMTGATREEFVGNVKVFLCPANLVRNDPSLPSPTHYVGLAGVGEHAAELPFTDPRAGFFGYDRQISSREIKDGLSTTMAITEVLDGGPWTAGGRAAVRGLAAGEQPYLGEGGQFSSLHQSGEGLLQGPVATNVCFADGSVRFFTPSVSPQVFEALATIAGGEKVDEVPP